MNGIKYHDFVDLVEVQLFQGKREGENNAQTRHAKTGFIPVLTRYIDVFLHYVAVDFPKSIDIAELLVDWSPVYCRWL